MGEPNENFLSYETEYEHQRVKTIANIIDHLSTRTRTIFYALKIRSKKYFDPAKRDYQTELAQMYVENNGLIYLDLMEQLGLSVGRAPGQTIEKIVGDADQRIMALVTKVAHDIGEGRLKDQDRFLTEELARLGVPVRPLHVACHYSPQKARLGDSCIGGASPNSPTI